MGITNPWFANKKNDPGKLTTWRSPDGNQSRQIDYICINQRYANTINCSRPTKGWRGNMNQNNQHRVILAKIQLKYKKGWRKENRQNEERNRNEKTNSNNADDNKTEGAGKQIIAKYDKNELRRNPEKLKNWAKEKKKTIAKVITKEIMQTITTITLSKNGAKYKTLSNKH